MHYTEATLDDLLRVLFEDLLKLPISMKATRGCGAEILGATLKLTNPRARLSRSESRGRLFSCLGEFLWYISGSCNLDFISYYVGEKYAENSDDGHTVHGGYGPRLFPGNRPNQFETVVRVLKASPGSRRAVIQLYDIRDIEGSRHKDVPCTCTLQFLLREEKLNLVVYMRSSDAYLGLAHDIFSFTMFQEIVARTLSVEIGSYIHMCGSLHIYEDHTSLARSFIREGWHTTLKPMSPMPLGCPWTSLQAIVKAEQSIRQGSDEQVHWVDNYWQQILVLLRFFARYKRGESIESLKEVASQLEGGDFKLFADEKLRKRDGAVTLCKGEIDGCTS